MKNEEKHHVFSQATAESKTYNTSFIRGRSINRKGLLQQRSSILPVLRGLLPRLSNSSQPARTQCCFRSSAPQNMSFSRAVATAETPFPDCTGIDSVVYLDFSIGFSEQKQLSLCSNSFVNLDFSIGFSEQTQFSPCSNSSVGLDFSTSTAFSKQKQLSFCSNSFVYLDFSMGFSEQKQLAPCNIFFSWPTYRASSGGPEVPLGCRSHRRRQGGSPASRRFVARKKST